MPLAGVHENPAHLKQLEKWLRSYKPDELFDKSGRLVAELKEVRRARRQLHRRQDVVDKHEHAAILLAEDAGPLADAVDIKSQLRRR